MSRSRRNSPFTGVTTAESDKPFKRAENRRQRAKVNAMVKAGAVDSLPDPREFGDPWLSGKDGKTRILEPNGAGKRYMRK